MILQQVENANKPALGFDSQKARISDSSLPFIFDTLSAHLYSRPYDSVVRELVSNMKDAHVRAKKHLVPCLVEYRESSKSLHFIDQGTGLSPEKMNSVYNDWGNSESRDNDELLGMYGLGSKSPFSITSIFYIHTYWENKLYIYSYVKEQGKLPLLTLLDEEEKEGCGTEIWFYTDKKAEFSLACKTELRYFTNVIVEGLGYDNNNFKLLRGKNFILNTSSFYSEMELCLGECRYSIDWAALGISKISVGLALWLDISAPVFPNPSRESLQLTDTAVAYLKTRISELEEELTEIYTQQNLNISSFFEYYKIRSNPSTILISGHKVSVKDIIHRPKVTYKHLGYITSSVSPDLIKLLLDIHTNPKKHYDGLIKHINLISNDNLYYSTQPVKITKTRALPSNWLAIILAKSDEEIKTFSNRRVNNFFDDHVYKVTEKDDTITIHNPHDIDPYEEIIRFKNEVLPEFIKIWNSYDAIVPKTVRRNHSVNWDNKTEVLAWYSNGPATRIGRTVESLKKVKQLVVCETEKEFFTLSGTLNSLPFTKKATKHYSHLCIAMRASATQMKKLKTLNNFISYDEFYKQEWLQKAYAKASFRTSLDGIFSIEMYKVPFIGKENQFQYFNDWLEFYKSTKHNHRKKVSKIPKTVVYKPLIKRVSMPMEHIDLKYGAFYYKVIKDLEAKRAKLVSFLSVFPGEKKATRRKFIIEFLREKLSKYEQGNQITTSRKKYQF